MCNRAQCLMRSGRSTCGGCSNARSEASALHGLDLRTELKFGDLGTELERELAGEQPTLLVIGVPFGGTGAIADVVGSLAPMLGTGARHPVMLVRTRAEAA